MNGHQQVQSSFIPALSKQSLKSRDKEPPSILLNKRSLLAVDTKFVLWTGTVDS
jgi:hypothetical protein